MKILPTFDRAIIRVIRDEKTRGGLFVPAIAFTNAPMERGEVLHAGPDCKVVAQGDVVWFAKPAAQAIPYPEEKAGEVVMVKEEGIIAILSDLDVATDLVNAAGAPLVIVRGEPS